MARIKTSIGTKEAIAMLSMIGFLFTYGIGMKALALLLFGKLLWDLFRLALAIRSEIKYKRKKHCRNFLKQTFSVMIDDQVEAIQHEEPDDQKENPLGFQSNGNQQ